MATYISFGIRRALLIAGTALPLMISQPVSAQAARVIDVDMPAQPLATSLIQIGRAGQVEVIFSASDLRGLKAPPLHGNFPTVVAMRMVLRGSGLSGHWTPQGAFLVKSANSKAPEGNGTAAPEADYQAGQGVSEIIVTARKRDERAIDVPVAVSALSGEAIERYATNSLTSISERIPQLVIGESTNQTGGSISLRGIGAGIANPSTEQAVTLNLDGIPISYGNAVRLGQLDLQRVEVLKGPQALFYGKNSPGGIISLISADPGPAFDTRLRTGYEFEAKQRFVEGTVSGPLSNQVGARIDGYYSKEDGWFRNLAVPLVGRTPGAGADSNNAAEFFTRGTLTFHTSDDALRLKGKVNYGQRNRDGVGPAAAGQPVYCPYGTAQVGLGVTTDCKLDRYFTDVALPANVAALNAQFGDGIPYAKSRQFLTSLSADYDVADNLMLSAVSGYYRLEEKSLDSFTSVNNPATGASNDVVAKAFSQELRLASNSSGPLNFLVGGFYQKATFTVGQAFYVYTTAPALIAATFYDQDTEAYSVFGQLRFKFAERFELAAGGRQSWEHKSLTGTVNQTPFTIRDPSKKYHNFSPDITLTYKPTRNVTIYGAYREGFTSGGFNTLPTRLRSPAFPTLQARDLSFDQETASGGEIGVKGIVADRQLSFDLVAYQYNYDGLQLSRWDATAFSQTVQNAGSARIRGFEFNMTVKPSAFRGLELRSALAYNDGRYRDFIGGCYAGQSVAQGCDLNPRDPTAGPSTFGTAANPYTGQDQTGQRLARSPLWALSGGFTYDHELDGNLGGSLSFDALYTSQYAFQTEADPAAIQKGYWLLNATMSLYGGDDRDWELALIGRNITNKLYTATGGALAFTGTGTGTSTITHADLLGVPGSPRSVLMQLTIHSSAFQ